MLHSMRLEFKHPVTNQELKLEAKIPTYFENVIKELRGK